MADLEEYIDPIAYDLENPSFGPDGPFYASLAQRSGGPILELGAGTGRITIPLAQAGFAVTALDLCEPMLAHGRAKSGDLPIRWVHSDATQFDLGETYGLAFLAGHAFQALLETAEIESLLRSVRRHLKTGGLFAFDTRNPSPGNLESDQTESDWFAYAHPARGVVQVSGFQVYDSTRQIQSWTTYRRWRDGEGRPQEATSRIRLRYLQPSQIDAMLAAHGFTVLDRFGDWGRGPVTAVSPELIYVAQAV